MYIYFFMQKTVYLFDLDGTLCESTKKITETMLTELKKCDCELGIVGGGTFHKIVSQLQNSTLFKYLFCENGCVNYIRSDNNSYSLIHKNSIRDHPIYELYVQHLLKLSLKFIAEQDFKICGGLIDVRDGLIYISLPGIQSTQKERDEFLELDKKNNYREKLYKLLTKEIDDKKMENISVNFGGATGVNIYPTEWDKSQVIKYFNNYIVHYFGDKYDIGGNDYKLINHTDVIGHKVNSPDDTLKILNTLNIH